MEVLIKPWKKGNQNINTSLMSKRFTHTKLRISTVRKHVDLIECLKRTYPSDIKQEVEEEFIGLSANRDKKTGKRTGNWKIK